MIENRINFRANFSNTTTPESSGARVRDADGNEYASIPLQLPSNLYKSSQHPKRVEMQLSKLNVPIGRVPIAEIGTYDIVPVQAPSQGYGVITKGVITCWPFRFNGLGEVVGAYGVPWYMPELSVLPGGKWPISRMLFSVPGQSGTTAYKDQIKRCMDRAKVEFFSVDEVCNFLTKNLQHALQQVLVSGMPSTFTKQSQFPHFIPTTDGRLSLIHETRDQPMMTIPIHNEIFNEVANTVRDNAPVLWKIVDRDGHIVDFPISGDAYFGYSIVVNRHIRDMFPALPWVKVDNSLLPPFNPATGSGKSILGWEEMNYGDSFFYVLDTSRSILTINQDAVTSPWQNSSSNQFLSSHLIYTFDNFDLTSIIPISAFIVVVDGIGMTSQTYPVNISSANGSSALTTSIPIVEVYYPLWQSISDLSTNLIIIKDQFSNTAPVVIDPNALRERNLKFSVYYITTSGGMELLKIPPNTCLSMQVCFSIVF